MNARLLLLTCTMTIATTLLLPERVEGQVLTFSGNNCIGTVASGGFSTPYGESGFQFTFTGAGWEYPCSDGPFYAGSPDIYAASHDAAIVLTKIGGGTFTLNSIDLAPVLNGPDGFASISSSALFTGTQLGGNILTTTLGWNGAVGNPTFVTDPLPSTWTNLITVMFSQGLSPQTFFQFDNVVLNRTATSVVPEPGSITLVAAGLIGIAGARSRRRKRTV